MLDSKIHNTTIQVLRKAEAVNEFGDYTDSYDVSVASGVDAYLTSIKIAKVALEQGQEFVGSHQAYANVSAFSTAPQHADRLIDIGDDRKAYDIVSLEKLRTPDKPLGHHYKFILKYV